LTIPVIGISIASEVLFPMNVSLTPELDRFVAEKVSSGRYTSASEVVREALRLLEERDRQRIALNRELEDRLQALDRGEHQDPDNVRARLQRKSRERTQP
jgi:antitoxin ParD1/3/4